MVGLTSLILRAHAGLHACEMKTCRVMPLLHTCTIKFKLICTVLVGNYNMVNQLSILLQLEQILHLVQSLISHREASQQGLEIIQPFKIHLIHSV